MGGLVVRKGDGAYWKHKQTGAVTQPALSWHPAVFLDLNVPLPLVKSTVYRGLSLYCMGELRSTMHSVGIGEVKDVMGREGLGIFSGVSRPLAFLMWSWPARAL